MKKGKIAVESQLSTVSDYLSNQGYDVVEFQHNQADSTLLQKADAVVVSGMDENYTGMHDIKTKAAVIDASGMTPEMIDKRLQSALEQ